MCVQLNSGIDGIGAEIINSSAELRAAKQREKQFAKLKAAAEAEGRRLSWTGTKLEKCWSKWARACAKG